MAFQKTLYQKMLPLNGGDTFTIKLF